MSCKLEYNIYIGGAMKEEDVFNVENIDDIPDSCKKHLKILNIRDDTRLLLNLFERKSRLSVDQIIIGLFRLHKIEKTRPWVLSTLYNLGKKNLIKKVSGARGEYEKV